MDDPAPGVLTPASPPLPQPSDGYLPAAVTRVGPRGLSLALPSHTLPLPLNLSRSHDLSLTHTLPDLQIQTQTLLNSISGHRPNALNQMFPSAWDSPQKETPATIQASSTPGDPPAAGASHRPAVLTPKSLTS